MNRPSIVIGSTWRYWGVSPMMRKLSLLVPRVTGWLARRPPRETRGATTRTPFSVASDSASSSVSRTKRPGVVPR